MESPDGIFGTTWGFTGLFLPEEAADPASTGPQIHRRIAKLRRSPRIKFPTPGVFELLVYTEEYLFPTLSREVAGHRQLCHWGMTQEVWLARDSSTSHRSSEDTADFS